MAGKDWRTSPDLKAHLLNEGQSFSFFQVMRLLRFLVSSGNDAAMPPAEEMYGIRVRPDLTLAFPAADVNQIEERGGNEKTAFRVTATFMGLYGSSSPLPTFYTEDLMDEAAADESVTREFLDVFNNRLYLLLFKAWNKYRQFVQVVEEHNEECIERLFCLLGLGEREIREGIPDAYQLIRYIGLFTQFPRSAAGLESVVNDALGDIPVHIRPCLFTMAKIPEDQRSLIGHTGAKLGRDCYLGEQIPDRMGKFRLELGPLDTESFQDLLPGGVKYKMLTTLTGLYVTDPLEYDIEITLQEGEARTTCLGSHAWGRLGLDTWVFATSDVGEVKTVFCPDRN